MESDQVNQWGLFTGFNTNDGTKRKRSESNDWSRSVLFTSESSSLRYESSLFQYESPPYTIEPPCVSMMSVSPPRTRGSTIQSLSTPKRSDTSDIYTYMQRDLFSYPSNASSSITIKSYMENSFQTPQSKKRSNSIMDKAFETPVAYSDWSASEQCDDGLLKHFIHRFNEVSHTDVM
mmetsp:Transcript_25481/g.37598  ORF Transcript_25481/g.37598 Transcript_25481/m.37598 type:complete len:177 (-) Transcript_25481:301-831(-)